MTTDEDIVVNYNSRIGGLSLTSRNVKAAEWMLQNCGSVIPNANGSVTGIFPMVEAGALQGILAMLSEAGLVAAVNIFQDPPHPFS